MTACERRIAILEILCERKSESIANLMFEFGVSDSTIRRDIQKLTVSYPVYTTQGNGGGVYVVEGYRLGRTYMTDKQTELLEEIAERLDGEKLKIMQTILKTYKVPQAQKKIRTSR